MKRDSRDGSTKKSSATHARREKGHLPPSVGGWSAFDTPPSSPGCLPIGDMFSLRSSLGSATECATVTTGPGARTAIPFVGRRS